jgi:hypothetical protein
MGMHQPLATGGLLAFPVKSAINVFLGWPGLNPLDSPKLAEDMSVRATKSGPQSSFVCKTQYGSGLVDPLLPESGTRKSKVLCYPYRVENRGRITEGSMLC